MLNELVDGLDDIEKKVLIVGGDHKHHHYVSG